MRSRRAAAAPDLPTQPPALCFSGVSHRYGEQRALVDLHLTVEAGQTVALVGPNGAGKSTTISVRSGRSSVAGSTSGTSR